MDSDPILMGMLGQVTNHYRVADGEYELHATTLDYQNRSLSPTWSSGVRSPSFLPPA